MFRLWKLSIFCSGVFAENQSFGPIAVPLLSFEVNSILYGKRTIGIPFIERKCRTKLPPTPNRSFFVSPNRETRLYHSVRPEIRVKVLGNVIS
jgi:hypothetical protein